MKNERLSEYLMGAIKIMKIIKSSNLEQNKAIDIFIEELLKEIEDTAKKEEGQSKSESPFHSGDIVRLKDYTGWEYPQHKDEGASIVKALPKGDVFDYSIQWDNATISHVKESNLVHAGESQTDPSVLGKMKALAETIEQATGIPTNAADIMGTAQGVSMGSNAGAAKPPQDQVWCPVCEEYHGEGKHP